MSVVAIISEYNPFHNGHLYHISQARELASASSVICIMSGSMVQRGEPAIFDKWSRTAMALNNGADLIAELPVVYATGSARRFAQGAVRLLKETGVINSLAFGTEASRAELLLQLAEVLSFPPETWQQDIKTGLSHGLSYATARLQATLKLIEKQGYHQLTVECQRIMTSPNNILALEYLIAINEQQADIKPIPIIRQGEGYHSLQISNFPSATFLRQIINNQKSIESLTDMVPDSVLEIIRQQISLGRGPIDPNDLETLLLYRLRSLSIKELELLSDVEPGMGSRIKLAAYRSGSREELRQLIKTKRYTMTRIDRILLYSLLNISKADVTFFDSNSPNYLRVLGCSSSGQKILQRIAGKSEITLINRVRPALKNMHIQQSTHPGFKSLTLDIAATDLQALLFPDPSQRFTGQDFTHSPIMLS